MQLIRLCDFLIWNIHITDAYENRDFMKALRNIFLCSNLEDKATCQSDLLSYIEILYGV